MPRPHLEAYPNPAYTAFGEERRDADRHPVPLGLGILLYLYALGRAAVAKRAAPTAEGLAFGAVVSFFDTLGIGCFAPVTA
jgi:hypothetical protein